MKTTDILVEEQLVEIERGDCPDCHQRGFVIGPMGGNSVNIECANLSCRSRFSVGFYASQVLMGSRIDKQSEGGHSWCSDPARSVQH